jgi:hypothetical protein
MNLSKSKYCNAIQCKKMLWLNQNKPEVATELSNDQVLDNGNLVHDTAKNLLGKHVNIEYNDNLNIMLDKTKELLENNKDHTNCTSANQSCLFHDLFIKTIDSNGVTTTEEEEKK